MIFDHDAIGSRYGIVLTSMLGALNDNIIKASLIVFAAMTVPSEQAASIGLVAAGLLMLPFILFSGWAGAIADKCEKAISIRFLKITELVLSGASLAAMMSGNVTTMLCMVFLMGTQSAFFGPLKLGWLPERIAKNALVQVNGWLETATFIGILAGTVIGSLLGGPETLIYAGYASLVIASLGLAASFMLPVRTAADPTARVPLNPFSSGMTAVREVLADRDSKKAAFLASWFWAAGSIYLSTLPAGLQASLGSGSTLTAIVMALFAGGIGSGAFLATRISQKRPGQTTTFAGLSILVLAGLMVVVSLPGLEDGSGLNGLIGTSSGIALCASLFLIALGGGLFEVPLKAMMQSRAGEGRQARAMAGYNLISSLAIAGTSLLVAALMALGVGQTALYAGVALSAVLALGYAFISFPREALRLLGRSVFRLMNRVEITGAENIPSTGNMVFISNHVSFADGPLLFSFLDGNPDIAVNTQWATRGLLGKIASHAGVLPIDPQSPLSAKSLAKRVREGGRALIFPEGRISVHGSLMKIYPGASWIIDMADAPVCPIHIEGAEGSAWARYIPGLKRSLFRKIRITIGKPQKLTIDETLRGKARRAKATAQVRSMMEEIRMSALMRHPSLPHMISDSFAGHDDGIDAILDPLGNSLSRKKIMIGAAAFSALLRETTSEKERIGVLLPGVATASVVLMGLWRAGLVPAILNPTLGPSPMLSAIRTGHLKRILSSRDFVAKAGLADVIAHLEAEGLEMIWTDDLKARITPARKLRALVAARNPVDVPVGPDDIAAVLYTSGTEGDPKGVVLSHGALVANTAQLRARADVSTRDRVLSAMPLFHSFGLTGGLILPLTTGAQLMIYPSPLHYRIIPQLAYDHQATLLFGTDTFLNGWARRADPADFASLRAAIAGAEAVKETTRKLWSDKFGVRILEGYGATEAGPVIALNTPDANLPGSVGRVLPGISIRQTPVPGLEGGQLMIKAPNLMDGYLMPGNTGEITGLDDGWYDTGDVVDLDADGFMRISGRVKRFAKIGGEMVSLSACEALAAKTWPDHHMAAITRKDARKGEKVIMVSTNPKAVRKDILTIARSSGIAEILVPSDILFCEKIPMLASGKTDYPGLQRHLQAMGLLD